MAGGPLEWWWGQWSQPGMLPCIRTGEWLVRRGDSQWRVNSSIIWFFSQDWVLGLSLLRILMLFVTSFISCFLSVFRNSFTEIRYTY